MSVKLFECFIAVVAGNEGLHGNCRVKNAFNSSRSKSIFETESVHGGCEHTHLIRSDAVHSAFRPGKSAPEISCSDDQCDFHSEGQCLFDSFDHRCHCIRIISMSSASLQGLSADFQQDSLIDR